MTVREFCLYQTQVGELCIIRDRGYIVHSVWIDYEDIFVISKNYTNKEVKSTEWGLISITTKHGDKLSVPCRYIDVE